MRQGLLFGSFLGAWLASAAASAELGAAAPKSTILRASVVWEGDCADRAALARELRARDVELSETTHEVDEGVAVRVAVARTSAGMLAAELVLSAAQRGREQRRIETRNCAELHQALAWVLLMHARERPAASPPSVSGVQAAYPEAGVSAEPRPALALAPTDARDAPDALDRIETAPPARREAQSRMGTALVAGFGFAPAPALGPLVFFEHEPGTSWAPALRLSAFQLSTRTFHRDSTAVAIQRLAARLGAFARTGWDPLRVGLGVEAGRLLASGTGERVRSLTDSAFWFSANASGELEIPLVARFLRASIAAELDYTPFDYAFRYRSGGELSDASALEVRAVLGLSAAL